MNRIGISVTLLGLALAVGAVFMSARYFTGAANAAAGAQDASTPANPAKDKKKGSKMTDKVVKTDEEWRKELTPEQYEVMRHGGTARDFTGA